MTDTLRHQIATNLLILLFILVAIAAGAVLGKSTNNTSPANAETPTPATACAGLCTGGMTIGGTRQPERIAGSGGTAHGR